MIECDVAKEGAVDRCFAELATHWPTIDFVVHALAFSDKNELKGAYMDTEPRKFRKYHDGIGLFLYRSRARRP
jgi:enoyl-[acyl-carrier protein] reductase I